MRRHRSYFGLQLKRAAALAPQMLAVTLLLAVLTALAALVLAKLDADDPSKQMIRLAVAGDEEEAILSDAVSLLESVDSSRFSIGFERMGEREASELLRRGKLQGYLLVPDGFARALWYGEHMPMTYYSASGGADVGAQLTRELVVSVSGLVLET